MTLRQRSLVSLSLLSAGIFLAITALPLRLPITCVFRRITGIPCATCGMTRASCALAHGELNLALQYHIAVIPFAICVIAGIVLLTLELVTNRPHVAPAWRKSARLILVASALTVLAGWFINLARL